MKGTLDAILSIYKSTISFALEVLFGKGCRFSPTCSEYAKSAIEKYGALKGSLLALRRLASCHPFASPRFDLK